MRLTPFALVFLLIGLSSPVTSFTFPQYKLPALTEEIQNVLLKSSQRFQITKKHHNLQIAWENLGNWLVILVFATVWQVLNVQQIQSPETEMMQICWIRFCKTREITLHMWTYLWRVLVIWNLCAAVVALMAVAANSCDCGAMVTSPMTMITMTVYFRYLILIEKIINNSKSLA